VEYPHFNVPPGSRDGILPDDAALGFARALRDVEAQILQALQEHEHAIAARAERSLLSDLRGAFEEVARKRPGLALLPIVRETPEPAEPAVAGAPRKPRPCQHGLLPPGPLAELVLTPDPIALPRGGSVVVRASARDAMGHEIDQPVTVRWSAQGAFATVVTNEGDELAATLTAGDDAGRGTLRATGRSDGREVEAAIDYEVLATITARDPRSGIPEPAWVDDESGTWRSRLADGRFEVNASHSDFRAADSPAAKLRYLSLLLAKEIALRNAAPEASPEEVLDAAVGIAAAAERAVTERGRRRGR
jgi:hypothetical protein